MCCYATESDLPDESNCKAYTTVPVRIDAVLKIQSLNEKEGLHSQGKHVMHQDGFETGWSTQEVGSGLVGRIMGTVGPDISATMKEKAVRKIVVWLAYSGFQQWNRKMTVGFTSVGKVQASQTSSRDSSAVHPFSI